MSVWEERDLLTRANSPWLIQAHYAFQDDANLYLVMDFLPGGDLLSLMHRCELCVCFVARVCVFQSSGRVLFSQEDIFTEENVRFYFAEILLAVNAVHHIGYVHRYECSKGRGEPFLSLFQSGLVLAETSSQKMFSSINVAT